MNRTLQKACATLTVGIALALPLTACTALPLRRPEAPPNHAAVSDLAGAVAGAGRVAAVVLGDTALLALQTNSATPGGTTSGRGASPALPGGAINPGGATPYGSPVHEQAAPNGRGGLAATGGSNNMPMAAPSSIGTAPMDVMNRVADQIRAKFPEITQVRVAVDPGDATRLRAIADQIGGGKRADQFRSELEQISQRALPTGTTTFPNQHPAQGQEAPLR